MDMRGNFDKQLAFFLIQIIYSRCVNDRKAEALYVFKNKQFAAKRYVYYPVHIESFSSLSWVLDYVYHISEDPAVNALYYFKAAGCLNEEMQRYTENEGFDKPKKLDFSILRDISETEVTTDNSGNFSFTLSDEQMALVQDARFLLAHYDKETGNVNG